MINGAKPMAFGADKML